MNNNEQQQNSPVNIILWLVVVALVFATVYGNNYFSAESLLYRILGILALSVLTAIIAFQTTQGKAFWQLLKGSRAEIRKVVWPNRQETIQTTLIVSVVIIIAGLLLWGLDTFLGWLASLVIG
jgi:preprotein translocase subunit SecE